MPKDDPPAEPYHFPGFTPPYYTPVPDAVFDELLAELTGNEVKVLLYIIRRTFGFKKESDTISLSQLSEGIVRRDGTRLDKGAGVSKAGAVVAVKGLLAKGCIESEAQTAADGGHAPTRYRLRFQAVTPLSRNQTLPVQNLDKGGLETAIAPVQNLDIQDTVVQETPIQEGNGRSRIKAPLLTDIVAGRHPTGKERNR